MIVFGTNFFVNAQTTLINPSGDGGFTNGTTFIDNGWTVENSANNPWELGTAVTTSPISGNSAYISNNGGAANAYTVTTVGINYFYRDITVPTGETKIVLTFNWICNGESTYDMWQLFIAPTSLTPVASTTTAGSTGTTLIPPGVAGATFIGSGNLSTTVQTATFNLPSSLAGTTFRLIFGWRNDGSGGTAPPAAIDNISLISSVPASLPGGSYTINKTFPTSGTNFNSFSDFASYINSDGISGPINLNVVSGTGPYNEQVILNQIIGSSAVNTITINGNNDTLQYLSANTNERATLKLNGTDYVSVNNLIFKSLGTTTSQYGFTVQLMNEANNNTFNNCQFIADEVTTSSNYCPLVTSNSATTATTAGLAASNLTVTNCILTGGYYGMIINGPTATPFSSNNIITNNQIKNFYAYGIYMRGQNNSVFSGNQISRSNRTTSTTTYMIYMNSDMSNSVVNKNKIFDLAGTSTTTSASYGIYGTGLTSTLGQELLIANNTVNKFTGMNGIQYGIYLSTTADFGNVKIYHNTISLDHITHTGASAIYCFYHTGANANLNLNNNIFEYSTNSTGLKYYIYLATNTANVITNNNVFYKTATAGLNYTGYWNSISYISLANWQAANTGTFDLQSYNSNPEFVSASNLTPQAAACNATGANLISIVPDDINGILRTNPPDIGAYEFNPPTCATPFNIVNSNIQPNSLNISWNAGSTETLWDMYYGVSPLTAPTGVTNPTVENISANPYTLSGLSQLTEYVYYLRADCSGNNSSVSAWAGPYSFTTTVSSLSGNYTINSTLPTAGTNFANFSDFAIAMNLGGFAGPVVVDVVSGTGPYVQQVIFNQIPTSSSVNTLTINGNGNTLQFLSTNTNERATLKFIGTDYVTVNNLIVKSLGTTTTEYGFTVQLMNSADYITFNNCQFIADNVTTSSNYCPLVTSNSATTATTAGLAASNLTITDCIISGGYYGMVLNGPTISPYSSNNIISNNEIKDFYYYGIYLSGQDNSLFKGNSIHRTNRSNVTTTYMIYLTGNVSNTEISKNKIYNFNGTVTTTSAAAGVYASSLTSPANQGVLFANNVIYGFTGRNATQYGFYLGTTGYAKLYHNSVSLDNISQTGTSLIYCVYHTGANANLDIRNNVFSYTSNSTGAKYNMYFNTNTAIVNSDYNVLHRGATAGTTNHTGYWSATAYSTLANWQAVNGSLYDQQSVDNDPQFVSSSILKPTSASVNDIGTDLSTIVVDDIMGVPRNNTPDPGAYEFIPLTADISLINGELVRVGQCLNTNDSIYFTIKNMIGNTIDFATEPLTINWFVNGPVNSSGSFILNEGMLALNNQLTIGSDGVDMSISGNYTLSKAFISSNPANQNNLNDTIVNISNKTAPAFDFAVQPDNALIINNTTQVPLKVNSNLFPGGDFFFSEICHYKAAPGAPTTWPSYLLADDYVEITGVPGSDLNGYTLEQWSTSALLSSYTFQQGTVLSNNGTAIIAVGQMGSSVAVPASYYYHGNGTYTGTFSSTGVAGRILKNSSGNIIDAVGYGTFTFPVASGVTATDWSGNTPAVSGSGNRLNGAYTKNSTNWASSTALVPQNPNTLNTGVTLPVGGSLTGFTWSLNGNVLSHNNPDTIVGPFTVNGIYNYIASYNTTCGIFTDTARIEVLIPLNDLKILAINSPVESSCYSGTLPVTISLTNLGSAAVNTSFTASYKVDAGTPVSETVNLTVNPLDTVNYTFATQVDLIAPSADVNYLITAYTSLTGDPFQTNDTLRKTVKSSYVPPVPTASNVNANYASSALLTASSGNANTNVYWYHNITDNVYFHTGLDYTTPVLYDTATYYISAGVGNANLKITELAINKSGTGITPTYPSWAPGADLFEITNLGNASVNLLGYKFNIYGATNPLNYTFTASVNVNPGEIVILSSQTGTDDISNRYFNMGGSTDIQSATANGYVLLKPDNTVVDAVAVNGYTFAANEASASDWSGNIPSTSGLAGPIRVVSDNNVASDWIVSSAVNTQTIGSMNPALSVGAASSSCQSSKSMVKAMITNFPAVDAGITNIILPSVTVNGGSSVAINARIKNYGLNNLTSAAIGWSINGVVQTPYQWTGDIARGDTSAIFNIANYTANTAGIINIQTWSYNPNGSVDNYATNDTVNGNILVNMAGNYTIGTGGDFSSFNDALTLLHNVGIGNNVVFNVLPGIYEERLTFNSITGTNASNKITFTSSTGDSTDVTLHLTLSSAAAWMMKFTGTSYITFNKMTLSVAGSATWGRIMEIASSANHIEISNCVLIGMPKATATTTNFSTIFSSGAGLNYNIFKNNRFEGGYRCIEMIGISGNTNKYNVISDNIFNDFYYSGSYTTYQDSMLITGNIYTNLSTTTSYSMYIANSNNFMVTKNKLNRMGATGTCYSLYLATINSAAGNALVANNFVMQSGGVGISHGVYCSSVKNTRIFNNSVSIKRGTTASYAFYNTGSVAGANIQVLNNIFANMGGGYAYYANSSLGVDSSNYNCLYATGTNLAYWGVARTSLAALQAASFRDAYSISINPNFVDSTDLHATNVALPEKGTSVPEVTDDIDGQARGLFPTIGADEFLGTRTLNLTILLEGLYNGVDMRPAQDDMGDHWGPTIADVITIELHNAVDPTITEATFTNQSLNTNGSCIVTVPANLGDQYYIVIKHRNSIVTWSSIPMSFNTSIVNYNFTSAASQAFGDNQIEVSTGIFALFVGDVNQDEVIDLSDLVEMDTDLTNGTVAYVVYDLNGDGVVDLSDLVAIDVNLTNGIVALYP